mmetsp:Transcript_18852/g.28082  ORF Transcript_18852/g.28082 Transcript_18852/m.28082 type:complete len:395 (+) Transcript_18852:202-1386(+)
MSFPFAPDHQQTSEWVNVQQNGWFAQQPAPYTSSAAFSTGTNKSKVHAQDSTVDALATGVWQNLSISPSSADDNLTPLVVVDNTQSRYGGAHQQQNHIFEVEQPVNSTSNAPAPYTGGSSPPAQVQVVNADTPAVVHRRREKKTPTAKKNVDKKKKKKSKKSASAEPKPDIEEHLNTQDLYKTELCRSFQDTGNCRYGSKCQFAHGRDELRPVLRHPKYKTEICKTFHSRGSCPYGKRCRFIHLSPDEANTNSVNILHWSQTWSDATTEAQQQQVPSKKSAVATKVRGSHNGPSPRNNQRRDSPPAHQSPAPISPPQGAQRQSVHYDPVTVTYQQQPPVGYQQFPNSVYGVPQGPYYNPFAMHALSPTVVPTQQQQTANADAQRRLSFFARLTD